MVISLAAAAMDTEVKLFFSFWSLSALRDPKRHAQGKNFISKIFGMMLPLGFKKEEMIDYPKLRFAGAATFVSDAGESSMQLFI